MQLKQSAANADASAFLLHMGQAITALNAERQRKSIAGGSINGGLVEIAKLENLCVVGDLHGDSKSLYHILSGMNYEQFLSNPMNKLVFLGDYVDRGSDSVGVMYCVCYLKSRYPDSVVLMRGNHEAPSEFSFASHDLPHKIRERFGDRGREVYRESLSMFELLALAVVVNQRLMMVHGGLPTEDIDLESLALGQGSHIKSSTLEELLWNDPRQIDLSPGWEKSRRGLGRHFGSSVSRRWLQASNTKVIVRGHEPCYGFRLDHDDTVMTLFSCTEAYPKFKAAYLLLNSNQLATVSNARDLSQYIRFLE